MIGLISATTAGRRGCERLAAAWPDRTRVYDGPVAPALERAFTECDQLVCVLATGAVVLNSLIAASRFLATGDRLSSGGISR
ncbi:MAG: cobalt-precorrin hydrolase / cobalt-factor methyltransferase / precorrin-3B [Streptomycetaceae bacterium]|nr:cobalt-precorrin hydrolase / cobalt-factor methyltransferase / precorrin-3B [Streptomycetaceae bacterium]